LPPWCLASPRLRLFSSPISTVVADVTHAVRYSLGMTGWTKMVAVVSVERTVAAVVAARRGADHGHDMCERWTIELTCETRTIWINTRQKQSSRTGRTHFLSLGPGWHIPTSWRISHELYSKLYIPISVKHVQSINVARN
jgi:hypothetical protein